MDTRNTPIGLLNRELKRFPRTPHLEGSRLQNGDSTKDQVPYSSLEGLYLVVEEKLDGANAALSFDEAGQLLLQSRGHYLVGGAKEKQFGLFKRWAAAHEHCFLERLEDRYVMYGEMMAKKHSVFYDRLPHIFLEFDIWDRVEQCFLSTAARQALLEGLPVLSVPVLFKGKAPAKLKALTDLLKPSLARTEQWKSSFEAAVLAQGLDLARAWRMCDKSDLSEGLYIKVESATQTLARFKWVRKDFVQAILDSEVHHSQQPFIANQLDPRVDIYSPQLSVTWEDLR